MSIFQPRIHVDSPATPRAQTHARYTACGRSNGLVPDEAAAKAIASRSRRKVGPALRAGLGMSRSGIKAGSENQPHPSKRERRRHLPVVAMICALLLGGSIAAGSLRANELSVSTEYGLKAGQLFQLARFIEWPDAAAAGAERPFLIAVIDDGTAVPVLKAVLAGRELAGRPVEVRAVSVSSIPAEAHVVFVTRAAGVTPEDVRLALATRPTLLVGETERFAERSGAIAFAAESGRFRLILCREHAAEHGLKVSARLASVARVVRPAPKT